MLFLASTVTGTYSPSVRVDWEETCDEILTRGLSFFFIFSSWHWGVRRAFRAFSSAVFFPRSSLVFVVWRLVGDAGHTPVASLKTHRQRVRTPSPLPSPLPSKWLTVFPNEKGRRFPCSVTGFPLGDFLFEETNGQIRKCPSYQAAAGIRSCAPRTKWSRSKTRETRTRSRSSPSSATRKRKETWQTSSHHWSTSQRAAPTATATTWV